MVTALFGEKKFGTFKFGPTIQTRPRFALEIDWDNDGYFDGRNDGALANSLAWERGRRFVITPNGDGFEEDMTGKLIASLVDVENWYDPFTNSDIGAGRLFRLHVRTPADNYFNLMAGTISEPVYQAGRGVPRVQINGDDGWGFLRDQRNRVTLGLQEGIYYDDAAHLMLDKVGWPRAWGRDLSKGVDRHPYWWADDKSAAKALHELAFSEMGRIHIAANGALSFRNRHFAGTSLFTITDGDVFLGSLKVMEPWEVVRNSIRIESRPRTLQTGVELWRSIEAIRLVPGASYEKFIDFTYNGEAVPVQSLIAPVAGVDYLANTQSDGSGVDMTASISVSVDYFSTRGKLTVQNNGSQAGYVLVPFTIRGSGLTVSTTYSQLESIASIEQYGVRSLDLAYEWVQNENVARYMARKLRDRLSIPKKHLEFEMRGNPDKQFALDLGTQVDVDITSKGISGTYRVYYLKSQWADAAGIATRTRVQLEPVEAAVGSWVVPTTIPMIVA